GLPPQGTGAQPLRPGLQAVHHRGLSAGFPGVDEPGGALVPVRGPPRRRPHRARLPPVHRHHHLRGHQRDHAQPDCGARVGAAKIAVVGGLASDVRRLTPRYIASRADSLQPDNKRHTMTDSLESRLAALEQRLQVVEDREAIIKLKAAYVNYNDGDWDGPTHCFPDEVAELFTEDGIWDGRPGVG